MFQICFTRSLVMFSFVVIQYYPATVTALYEFFLTYFKDNQKQLKKEKINLT